MPGPKRYQIEREEIGLLLSFARRPEAFTTEWTDRLQRGVDLDELRGFFKAAGLPNSTLAELVGTDAVDAGRPRVEWSQRNLSYRRATIGLIVLLVVGAVGPAMTAGNDLIGSVVLSLGFLLVGYAIYRLIVRFSSS